MPVDTSRAIGAVTELLTRQLRARTTAPAVTHGRPEPPTGDGAKLNVFLYEAIPDGQLRSHALDARPSPVWLSLRYLVTAFSSAATGATSDSPAAHRYLGEAIRALHNLAYLPISSDLPVDDANALRANPEPLKVTFVPAGSELLGRLMQGSDEKYRCSIAVEVRPVMIAGIAEARTAPLVGVPVDGVGSPTRLPGVHIGLEAIAAPVLSAVTPTTFEAGQSLTLTGRGFAEDLARLAGLDQPITRSGEDLVTSFPAGELATRTSAGALPLAVARELVPATRYRVSEPVIVRLLPTLATATISRRVPDPMGSDADRSIIDIDLGGQLLGRPQDDTIVALWTGGRTVASGDEVVDLPGDPQTARRVTIYNVPPSTSPYYVFVRVNGSQALVSPHVEVAP